MRVAILSESEVDESAIRVLTDGILGSQTQSMDLPTLRSRGWPSVRRILPSVLKHLHYQTDAEGLVVIVDSDMSHIHEPKHNRSDGITQGCRLCQLRKVVDDTKIQLRPIPNRIPVRVAVGLAVPEIEAWYRCGIDSHISEATWIQSMQSNVFSYDNLRLKQAVYGSDRASITIMKTRAIEEARRLVQNVGLLETHFPNGFGVFANDVRSWEK